MSRIAILVIMGLILCGCVTTQPKLVWDRPESYTDAQFQQDYAKCKYEAELNTQSPTPKNIGEAIGQGIDEGLRKNKLTELCMQAKGWYLVEAGSVVPKSTVTDKPILGISFIDAPDAIASLARHRGVLIVIVQPNSVAAKCGIKSGDLLYEVAGTPVTCMKDCLPVLKANAIAGKNVPLKVIRGQDAINVTAQF